MKIILCGYNWIGCKALSLLLRRNYEVFVFTHKHPPHINSLLDLCKRWGVNHSIEKIKTNNIPFVPDVICSTYYRYIIGQKVIDLVKGRIFNLHPSLLPDYRGCSSLTWAMINGEKEVGYSYHYITAGIDEGNILIQKKIVIEAWDTQATLYHRVMFESANDFLPAFDMVVKRKQGQPQPKGGNYYSRGCPFNGKIEPNWDIEKKERFIRAMNYPPLPYARTDSDIIKTYSELLAKDK